jgi:hypothetical protein
LFAGYLRREFGDEGFEMEYIEGAPTSERAAAAQERC